MKTDFKRTIDETEDAYIYRICALKDQQGIIDSWYDVRDILNESLGKDYTESAYRKKYQYFKKMLNAKMDIISDSDAILSDIRDAQRELEYEKIKLRDERTALNKSYREIARSDDTIRLLEEKISDRAIERYAPVVSERATSEGRRYAPPADDTTIFVCLSDLHIGADTSCEFGTYNTEVAHKRMDRYLKGILKIVDKYKSRHCVIALMGDLINSNIHKTIRITNRENVVEQVVTVSEMLSDFIFSLSGYFEDVRVVSVPGNHSRLGKKDEVLRNERLDDLVTWYLKSSLKFQKNISFVDSKYDPTIASVEIYEKEYLVVHGDFDSFSESGTAKLVMMIGHIPDGIFFGHQHKCSYDDVSGVKIVRSGSLSSPVDDYCVSKRIKGHASQMVCVCDRDGIAALFPINLEERKFVMPELDTTTLYQADRYENFK